MNVLSGIYPFGSYDGEIVYNEKTCHFMKIRDSESCGIVIIHQSLRWYPISRLRKTSFSATATSVNIDWNETYAKADELLAVVVGLHESSHTLIKDQRWQTTVG